MASSSRGRDRNGDGDGDGVGDGGRARRRQQERPSSSRQRFNNSVWPEPFVEALVYQVAVDAATTIGRLAAGSAIANLFQVCSTWRAISRSDILWQNLTRRIWGRNHTLLNTWQDEFIYRHRTARNFRIRRAVYTTLDLDGAGNDYNNNGPSCRCLALSDFHLACGFVDGSVHVFDLFSRLHVGTFLPHQRDRLGPFSYSVSGIVLSDSKLVFASLDGDILVAFIGGGGPRRAHLGNVVNDGALIDFGGCRRWWVGLFAGVPGRAFHVWDANTEELVFVGGSLTDPEAVMGWHMLTELSGSIGRIRVSSRESAVACSPLKVMVFDLRNPGVVLGEEEFEQGLVVESVDGVNDKFVVVDNRGLASVRRVDGLEEVCRFTLRGRTQGGRMGCMNGGYMFVCSGGVIRVWDVDHGEFLYSLRERVAPNPTAFIADERHVAACFGDSRIHLWDFGALL